MKATIKEKFTYKIESRQAVTWRLSKRYSGYPDRSGHCGHLTQAQVMWCTKPILLCQSLISVSTLKYRRSLEVLCKKPLLRKRSSLSNVFDIGGQARWSILRMVKLLQ